jgi:GxxExxY protein
LPRRQALKHEALTEQLIGVFYTIYTELGNGFLESIYQKAFAVVLAEKGLQFEEQAPIEVVFHGVPLGDFKADLVAESLVLIELKAVKALEDAHERQVLNYLKATNIEVALLFNFGPRPQVRRFVLDNELKAGRSAATSAGS